jgi:hypothetical protein
MITDGKEIGVNLPAAKKEKGIEERNVKGNYESAKNRAVFGGAVSSSNEITQG